MQDIYSNDVDTAAVLAHDEGELSAWPSDAEAIMEDYETLEVARRYIDYSDVPIELFECADPIEDLF